jgi:putative PIG3 family NAD(P)H quinone oxidoreductase
VRTWEVGDKVCALLTGGGYASQVTAPAGQVMPLPPGLTLIEAASVPEVACTVWSNLVGMARLQPGESLLVHGGAGGIGSFAVPWARAVGAQVFTTAGSAKRLEKCEEWGAERAINYREEDFVEVVKNLTAGRGVDVILDNMGAKYLARNLAALAPDGRLVVIGLQGGTTAELDLGSLLGKRGSIYSASLRNRPLEQKALICGRVVDEVWPMYQRGELQPKISHTLPLSQAAEAHQLMQASGHLGKILLLP